MFLCLLSLNAFATDRQWLLLLDYKKNIFGGYKSEAQSADYFLAPDGATSPDHELDADAHAIFNDQPIYDKHALCRFPARASYLAQKLNKTLPPETNCTELQKFRSSFKSESVSLVFSAYYTNNPSSTFGHTFLRFNQHREYQDTDLTDLSVNYAANPWSMNPILYSIGGIAGWFDGVFSTVPYYYKVREYNDFESRDLWSYKLKLKPTEIHLLMDHLWELGHTRFDYYFFTQNCSYHILTAVEAAAPEYPLTRNIPYWVIPSDTVLAFKNVGAIGDISYRASARKVFISALDQLAANEKTEFFRLVDLKSSSVSNDLNPLSQTKIIDVLLDWMDYKHFKTIKDVKSADFGWYKSLLERRAELPTVAALSIAEPTVKPHLAHPSARLEFAAGYNDQFHDFERFSLRYALHDLLDPDGGYPEKTQIEFFNLSLQTSEKFKDVDLYKFHLVDVLSLNPWTSFEKGFSWKMNFGVDSFQGKDCKFCQAAEVEFGAGVSIDLTKRSNIFVLGQVQPLYSSRFYDHELRLKSGPEVGLLFTASESLKGLLTYDLFYDLIEKNTIYNSQISIRKSFRNLYSVGANYAIKNDIQESALEFYYYF